jgi:hypothetical protein
MRNCDLAHHHLSGQRNWRFDSARLPASRGRGWRAMKLLESLNGLQLPAFG